jgi:hypothetical protein
MRGAESRGQDEAMKKAALLSLVVLAGCGGGQSAEEQARMEQSFAGADYQFAVELEKESRDGSGNLEAPTRNYIAVIREYQDELGDEEAARRLADKASEIEKWCPGGGGVRRLLAQRDTP